jgi:hypothetical protein
MAPGKCSLWGFFGTSVRLPRTFAANEVAWLGQRAG